MAEQPQTSKTCPKCGSKRFKLAPSQSPQASGHDGIASPFAMRDRICKDCGTQYKPEMPGWLPYLLMVMGCGLILSGIALMFEGMKGPTDFRLWVKIAFVLGGLVVVAAGVRLVRRKKSK